MHFLSYRNIQTYMQGRSLSSVSSVGKHILTSTAWMPIQAPLILNLRMRRSWISVKCVVKLNAYKKSLLLCMAAHTGANVCICDICYKSLTNKEHLKFHCRIHEVRIPVFVLCVVRHSANIVIWSCIKEPIVVSAHICKVCNKSFTQHSTLVIHKCYHRAETLWVSATSVTRALYVEHFWTPIRKATLFSSRYVPSDYSVCTPITPCSISGFCHEVVEIFSLLGCCKV